MSAQDSPHENSTSADDSDDERPETRAARERAEAMVRRREHPTRDATELIRPRTVVIGCLMTWSGAALLLYSAFRVLGVNENSPSIDSDWTASEVDTAVQAAHGLGVVFITWAISLTALAFVAFFGHRWGATGLFVMASVVVVAACLSVLGGFALEGVTTAVWSITAAILVRFRELSKDWYVALADARTSPV